MSNIVQRARELRALVETLASANMSDELAVEFPEVFPEWDDDEDYMSGDRVKYKGVVYKCLQSHTSQETWTPEDATSLWDMVLNLIVKEWVQPNSTNAYMQGDVVLYMGAKYVSTVDNNVWAPSVYGWELVDGEMLA